MEKIDEGKLWELLQSYLIERNLSIGGKLENLRKGLYKDFKLATRAFPTMTVREFLECFVDELLCFPLQVSDKTRIPNGQ